MNETLHEMIFKRQSFPLLRKPGGSKQWADLET